MIATNNIPIFRFSKLALMTFALDCELEVMAWIDFTGGRYRQDAEDGFIVRRSRYGAGCGESDDGQIAFRIGGLKRTPVYIGGIKMRWPHTDPGGVGF